MLTIKKIIKNARGNMSQADFARLLGKSQGLISKYERGTVNPPTDAVEKCMNILEMNNNDNDASAEILAQRIRAELKKPQLAYARQTISSLLDGIKAINKI